ncbi:hypothetical protein GCM10023143_23870 [Compostibacter hankyongensis]|uniref:PKD domain-containing protein n=1 Tax=Compostibacter hankyongensis TaxID=1007089 RepID=A0ABP8FYF1_9BACT
MCIAPLASAAAQDAGGLLQFQENKGQWNDSVLYRAEVPGGYVFLREGGFTFSLYSPEDISRVEEAFHGEGTAATGPGSSYIVGPGHQPGKPGPAPGGTAPAPGNPWLIRGHAYQLNFLHANPHPAVAADHPAGGAFNYLLGKDSSRWRTGIRAYGGMTYQQLYTGVDMRVYSQSDRLKYDLIVHPGGDIRNIALQYLGAEELSLRKGHLHIRTSVGEVIEVAPYAYQIIGGQKTEVPCSYRLKGNILRFSVSGRYDRNHPLVIDPTTVFATFSGAKGDNWGYTATYDAGGNFYLGGIIFGNTGSYPVTPGAFQTSFGGGSGTSNGGAEGGYDIALSKFSADGHTLIYATYLGGSGDEQPHSMIVDSKGDLIISARTNSSDFPGNKVGTNGSWDMTVTELNPSGSGMIGSLVIGGSGEDGVNIAEKYSPVGGKTTTSLRRFYGDDARSEVNIGPDGNIYVVGCSRSSDFPTTPGVFQEKSGGGQQDGVVIKLKPDLSGVIWSSFIGGSADDAAYVINFGKSGDLYVAGGTSSTSFPIRGTHIQGTFGGGPADGFIAEIRADGSAITRSTFLGTKSADQVYGIQSDDDGNIYVTGTTEGKWTVTDNARYSGINENGKQFICKLKPDLSGYIYSTVFGSSGATEIGLPNISPTAFLVDRCQNVYVAGWGGMVASNAYPNAGTNGLPLKNPINPQSGDGRDFYFFVLKKDAKDILFASTYGQNGGGTDHVDGGTSRFDPNGVIYEAICGNCGGQVFWPTGPPGVYSIDNGSRGGSGCNAVALKIAFNLDGIRGGVETKDRRRNYCVGDPVTFIDTLYGRKAQEWIWNIYDTWDLDQIKSGSLTPVVSKTQPDTQDSAFQYKWTPSQQGNYTMQMIKHQPDQCIEYDTSYVQVKIGNNPATVRFSATKVPPCDQYAFQFENLSSNKQGIDFDEHAFLWDFGDGTAPDSTLPITTPFQHKFPQEGNYTVRLLLSDTANFCNTPLDTVKIVSASDQLKPGIQVPDTLCGDQQVIFTNTTLGGTKFTWKIKRPFGLGIDSVTMTDLSPLTYNPTDSGMYLVTLVVVDEVCAREDSVTDSMFVYPTPEAGFSVDPQNGTNQIIHFTNESDSKFDAVDGNLSYRWDFGDGGTSTDKDAQHLYTQTGSYKAVLYAYNRAGCMDTAMQVVNETIIPAMDMPKAFTPNNDGVNDRIAPRAFGVIKVDFRIYNRWGQLVFRSEDPGVTYDFNKGWDGRFNGKPQEMDVYTYILNVEFNDGNKATKQGSITLIR